MGTHIVIGFVVVVVFVEYFSLYDYESTNIYFF